MDSTKIAKLMILADRKKIGGGEARLLLAIVARLNAYDRCETSNEILAQHLEVTERAITKWLSSLEDAELVTVKLNRRKHRRQIYINHPGGTPKFEPIPQEDWTEAQKRFHEVLPQRIIDAEWPDDYDMELLIQEIKMSEFLQSAPNMSFRSFVRWYPIIIKGKYRTGTSDKRSNFKQREYSEEEMNSLYQDIGEIEI